MQMKQDITDAGDADVGVNRNEDKERYMQPMYNWCRTDVEIKYKRRCSIYVAVDADVVVILRAGCSGGFQRQPRSSTLDPVDPRSSQCRSTMQILHGTSQPTIVAQILWSRPRNFASAHFDFQTDSDLQRLAFLLGFLYYRIFEPYYFPNNRFPIKSLTQIQHKQKSWRGGVLDNFA